VLAAAGRFPLRWGVLEQKRELVRDSPVLFSITTHKPVTNHHLEPFIGADAEHAFTFMSCFAAAELVMDEQEQLLELKRGIYR